MKIPRLIALTFVLAATLTTAHAQVGKSQSLLDANLATESELSALPDVNEALAKQIVEQRPFATITQLNTLLGESLRAEQILEVYKKAFIHVNLNGASEKEILLIPGVGKRMAHEFEEYRPYKAMAQFRREIGKYVDDEEVARLEQYVFVPINLNSATDEDILSIPGVGKRMLHEFKEYRPYKSMEQFRREIGKYVDKKEVARLERFVTVQ